MKTPFRFNSRAGGQNVPGVLAHIYWNFDEMYHIDNDRECVWSIGGAHETKASALRTAFRMGYSYYVYHGGE